MSDQSPPTPLHVDTEWKAQAQREKERLSASASSPPPSPAPSPAPSPSPAPAPSPPPASPAPSPPPSPAPSHLPPASFSLLIEQFLTQILFALGLYPHPTTGKPTIDLDLAKHYIDLLAILHEKTQNNLTPDEQRLLDRALLDTRMQYVKSLRTP